MKYEMMILLTEEFNDSELKTWAFNYAKALRKLSASEISVISRGKRDLAYMIKNQKRGNFYIISSFYKYPYQDEKLPRQTRIRWWKELRCSLNRLYKLTLPFYHNGLRSLYH